MANKTESLRSDSVKKGMSRAPARGLMRATGMKDEDFEKPLVAIANSYNTIVPGHIHLNELVAEVKKGVEEAGGVCFEFGVLGICDGIAMGRRASRRLGGSASSSACSAYATASPWAWRG